MYVVERSALWFTGVSMSKNVETAVLYLKPTIAFSMSKSITLSPSNACSHLNHPPFYGMLIVHIVFICVALNEFDFEH